MEMGGKGLFLFRSEQGKAVGFPDVPLDQVEIAGHRQGGLGLLLVLLDFRLQDVREFFRKIGDLPV
jgi:hypothetical protein